MIAKATIDFKRGKIAIYDKFTLLMPKPIFRENRSINNQTKLRYNGKATQRVFNTIKNKI